MPPGTKTVVAAVTNGNDMIICWLDENTHEHSESPSKLKIWSQLHVSKDKTVAPLSEAESKLIVALLALLPNIADNKIGALGSSRGFNICTDAFTLEYISAWTPLSSNASVYSPGSITYSIRNEWESTEV